MAFCSFCGGENPDNAKFCLECGAQIGSNSNSTTQTPVSGTQKTIAMPPPQQVVQTYYPPSQKTTYSSKSAAPVSYSPKSRVAAGLLGIFLGGCGAGRFYLGYAGLGVAQLLVSLFTLGFGAIWGLIDGIVILCGGVAVDGQGYKLGD